MNIRKSILALLLTGLFISGYSESGYRLWLRYDRIDDQPILQQYRQQIKALLIDGDSPTLLAAKKELQLGLNGLLGLDIPSINSIGKNSGVVVCGTFNSSSIKSLNLNPAQFKIGKEGFVIKSALNGSKKITVIVANEDVGVLYGVFQFLRLLQTNGII
jgi:alpha-glucuronidase